MSRTVKVGSEEVRLESFSGLKATWLIAVLEEIQEKWEPILDAKIEYVKRYEQKHARVLNRTSARLYYQPEPLMDEEPIIVKGKALTTDEGLPLVNRTPKLDENNQPIMGPDPLGHMTEDDWAASDHKLILPQTPSQRDAWLGVLPQVMKLAKEQVLPALGLVAMSEDELDRHDEAGNVMEEAMRRGKRIRKAPLRDLVKFVATASAFVDEELKATAEELGVELPNTLSLFGPDSSRPDQGASGTESTKTKPTSSTGSRKRTGGSRESSSEPVGASSSRSDAD